MAKNLYAELFGLNGEKIIDGAPVPAQFLPQLRELAQMMGTDRIVIKDTETTDEASGSQIYEFGAIEYDLRTNRAIYIHKYIEKSATTNFDKIIERVYKRRPGETSIDYKRRVAGFAGLPTEKQYAEMKKKGLIMSRADFLSMLQGWQDATNFAYNAAFDFSHEKLLGKEFRQLSYKSKYDIMTMATKLVPEVIPADYGVELGRGRLEKYYAWLYDHLTVSERKKYNFIVDPAKMRETHKAAEDVAFYTLPVLMYLVDVIRKKGQLEGYNIHSFEGIHNYWAHKQDEEKQQRKQIKLAGFKPADRMDKSYAGGFKTHIDKIAQFRFPGGVTTDLRTVVASNNAFFDAQKFTQRINTNMIGKTAAQQQAMKQLTSSLGDKGANNTKKLLQDLDGMLRSDPAVRKVGYQFKNTGVGGELTVYIVPNDNAFLQKIHNNISQLPQFKIAISNKNGILSHYGMKGINQWKADIRNGQALLYTTEQAQILDVLQLLNKGYVWNYLYKGDYRNFAKTVQRIIYAARGTTNVAGNYVSDDSEFVKAQSGTGTKAQMMARKSFVEMSRFFAELMSGRDNLIYRYMESADGRSGKTNFNMAQSQVLKDLKEIALVMGSYDAQTASRMIEQNRAYRYIVQDPEWVTIKKHIQAIVSMGLSAGTSGENSFEHMLFSTMSVKDLSAYGGWDREDSRKSVQVANIKEFSSASKAYRQNLAKGRVHTATEIANGIVSREETEALFGYTFITQQDINKAYVDFKKEIFKTAAYASLKSDADREKQFIKEYGKNIMGAHSGGSLYALGSDFETKGLESVDYLTPSLSKTRLEERITKLAHNKKLDPASDEYNRLRELAVRQLLRIPNDTPFHVIEKDADTWRVEYVKVNKMKSGAKLLTKVDEDRTTAQGIHPEIFKRIVENKGLNAKDIQLLKELPDSFKSSNISGLIGGYLNYIVQQVYTSGGGKKSTNLKNFVDELNAPGSVFQGIFKYVSRDNEIMVDSAKMHSLTTGRRIKDVIEKVNELGKKFAGVGGDAFKKVNNGYQVTSFYRGMSQMGQADVARYGDPVGKVVSADYRFTGAIKRSVGLFSTISSQNLSNIGNFLVNSASISKENQVTYNKLIKEEQRLRNRTMASGKQNYRLGNKDKLVSVGYGSGYDVDLRNFTGDELVDAYKSDGTIDFGKYQTSVYAAIDRARKEKARLLSTKGRRVKPEDIEAYIDLGDTVAYTEEGSNYSFAARHVYIPYFNRMRTVDQEDRDANYTLPDYISKFNALIRGVKDRAMGRDSAQLGAKAFAASSAMWNYVYNKSGSGYKLNKVKLPYSMMAVANAGNPSLVGASVGTIDRNLGTGDIMLSYEDLLQITKQIGRQKGDSKVVLGNKLRSHISLLQKQAEALFEGGNWENAFRSFVNENLSEKIRRMRETRAAQIAIYSKRMNEWEKNRIKRLNDDLNGYKGSAKNRHEKYLQGIHKISEEKARLLGEYQQKINARIIEDENKLKAHADSLLVFMARKSGINVKDERAKRLNDTLARFIVEAVTFGTDTYEQRLNKEKGLEAVFARFPLSNGLDIKYSQAFANKQIKKNQVIVGLGLGRAVNLDFDGDYPPIWMPLLNSVMMGHGAAQYQELSKEFDVLRRMQKHSTGVVALTSALDLGEGKGMIKSESIAELEDFQTQIKAAIGGKEFKGSTGALSNSYQAVVQALERLGLDEASLGGIVDPAKKEQIMYIIIARAFFEKLTQDAISSKKVFDRLKKENPDKSGGELALDFLKDLDRLLFMINDPTTFKDASGIRKMFDLADQMHILDFGADRITAQVLSYAQDLVSSKEDEAVFKKVFGVDINTVRFRYNEQGDLIGFGSIDLTGENYLEKARAGINKKGFNDLTITRQMLEASVHHVNELFLKQENKNIGQVINDKQNKPGVATGTLYRIGDDTAKVLLQYTAEAAANLKRLKQRSQEHGVQHLKSTKGLNLLSLEAFFDKNKKLGKYDITSVYTVTGYGHKIDFDKRQYSAREQALLQQVPDTMKYSVTQIANVLHKGGYGDNAFALEFGTLHHAVIESIFRTEELGLDKGNRLTAHDLERWIREKFTGSVADAYLVRVLFDKNGQLNMEYFNMLLHTVNQFLVEAESVGLDKNAYIETPMGIVLNIDGKKVLIGGTIDQIWMSQQNKEIIGDAKTSAYPYLTYVIQLSLYNAIRRAFLRSNEGVESKMHLFMTQKLGDQLKGEIVDVEALSDSDLINFIQDAMSVLKEADEVVRQRKIDALMQRWNPILQQRVYGTGGASPATILLNKEKEFPVTWEEAQLRKMYEADVLGKTLGYENWIATALKSGKITNDAYHQHAMFVGSRGNAIREYLTKLSVVERNTVEAYILSHAENQYSIAHAYKLAKNGAVNYVDLASWNNFHKIDVSDGHILTQEEEEEDMVNKQIVELLEKKVQDDHETMEMLKRALLGTSTGTAPSGLGSSGTGGSSGPVGVGAPAGQDEWDKIVKQYIRIAQVESRMKGERGDILAASTAERDSLRDRLFGTAGWRDGGGRPIDLSAIDILSAGGLIGDLRTALLAGGMTEQAFKDKYASEIQKANDEGLQHRVAIDDAKRRKEYNAQLEKTTKLYKELLNLREKLNRAEQTGDEESIAYQQQLYDDKASQIDELTQNLKGSDMFKQVDLDKAKLQGERAAREERKKEREKEEMNNLKNFRDMLRRREDLDKQLYRNQRSRALTFVPNERMALDEEREWVLYQNTQNEQSIASFLKSKAGDPYFSQLRADAEEESALRMARNRARINVQNKGNHTLWGQLGSQFAYTMQRFTQYGAAYKIIGQVRQGISTVVNAAKELDKSMTNLRIVTGANRKEAHNMLTEYAKLGDTLGSTTTEVANSAQEWLRQGYAVNEVTQLVTSSMYLSKLGMMDSATATRDLTSAMKGFKLAASDTMSIVDKFTALDIKAATTAGDIAEGLAQFANVATLNGVNIDQAAAMVATIADITQNSGTAVGNSLKMIMSRYSNVKSGAFNGLDLNGEESADSTEALNEVDKVLRKVGISIRDSSLAFRDFGDVLDDISAKWDSLDNVSKNAIATALAGTRQRESIITLLNNYDKYKELLETSQNSAGTAQKKYLSYQEHLEAQTKKLQAAWESFANSADVQKFLTEWTKLTTLAVKWLPTIVKYLGRLAVISQAYKLPNFLGRMTGFMLGTGEDTRPITSMLTRKFTGQKLFGNGSFGLTAGERLRGLASIFTGGRHRDAVERYYSDGGVQSIWRSNTQAVIENTRALLGITRTGGNRGPASADNIYAAQHGKTGHNDLTRVTGFNYNQATFSTNAKYQKYKSMPSGQVNSFKRRQYAITAFDQRDYSKPVRDIGNEYEYFDTAGNRQRISKKDYQAYQQRATQYQLTNYYKAPTGGVSMAQQDQQFLDTVYKGADGHYHYKAGTVVNGKTVSGQYVGDTKVAEAQSRQAAGKQAAASKAAGAVAIGVQGVAGAVTGALTASTTSKDQEGNEYKMSGGAEGWSRGSTAVVQGLGSMISPALGSLLGLGMDALWTYKIGPKIDEARIHMEKRVKKAEVELTALSSINSDINTLKQLSNKDLLTPEDIAANEAAMDSILDTMYKRDEKGKDINKKARDDLRKYLVDILKNQGRAIDETASLGTIMEQFSADSAEDRKALAHALALAQAKASTEAIYESQEDEYELLRKEGQDAGYNLALSGRKAGIEAQAGAAAAGAGLGTLGASAGGGAGAGALIGSLGGPIGAGGGAIIGALIGLIGGAFSGWGTYEATKKDLQEKVANEWNTAGYQGQIEWLERDRAALDNVADTADYEQFVAMFGEEKTQELLDERKKEYDEQIRVLKEIRDQTRALNKKVDQSKTQEAVLGAQYEGQYLALMTETQLRALGADEIKRIVANYLIENGGYLNSDIYANPETGELTSYANQLITAGLKGNDVLRGIVTGQTYTLSEALKLPKTNAAGQTNFANLEILENFANALHVSVEELAKLEEKFGKLTLNDFLLSATEAIEKLQTVGSLMSEIANASKAWAETTNTIINNFPQLIPYMSDSVELQKQLWNYSEQLADIQIQGLYDNLASSSPYYQMYIKPTFEKMEGYDKLAANSDFSKIQDIDTFMKWANKYRGSEEFGALVEEMEKVVKQQLSSIKLVSDMMREQINNVLQHQVNLLQKDIDNLNEQKSALEEINKQREYENRLIEAKIRLEEAQKEKKRVWREGVGWVYESDQKAIDEAQKNLADVEREKPLAELQTQIDMLLGQKSALEEIAQKRQWEEQQALYDSFCEKYFDGENGIPGSMQEFIATMDRLLGKDGDIYKIASDVYDQMQGDTSTKAKEAKANLQTAWEEVYNTSHNADGSAINWSTATEDQKAAYNNALAEYQRQYTEAVNNGYISSTDFSDETAAGMFGSKESQTATTAAPQDIQKWAVVDPDDDVPYKVTFGTGTLSSKEKENIWGDWDKGGHHGQIWDASHQGKNMAIAQNTPGYRKSEYADLDDYAKNHPNSIGLGDVMDNSWFGVDEHGTLRKVSVEKASDEQVGQGNLWSAKASGDLSYRGGLVRLNELGTEAIITPSGTLTSLPSQSGIIPADITRNLWQLGDLAPAILRSLGYPNIGTSVAGGPINNSDSVNIGTITMTVNADSDWDAEKFIQTLKQQASLSKNIKR